MFLASKLADLSNLSMSHSRIPSSWRKIVITPVYKSGPRENFANYRPVSVRPTSVVCRVMERITCIVSVIFDFIDRNNIINPSLHDFLPCRSVETASLAFYNFPLKNLGLRHNVEVLLLDFAKAFEKVPHDILLQKLSSCGFGDPYLSWIADFLSNRTQSVRVESFLSIVPEMLKVVSSRVRFSAHFFF